MPNVGKNQIVLRENQAKDYERTELGIGLGLPDFSFVDLNGKKRKFSEFRGKYVLLDFWQNSSFEEFNFQPFARTKTFH